ncbi:hypothetical protein ACOSQ3_007336 [Xanthoceras sorbifolium]
MDSDVGIKMSPSGLCCEAKANGHKSCFVRKGLECGSLDPPHASFNGGWFSSKQQLAETLTPLSLQFHMRQLKSS